MSDGHGEFVPGLLPGDQRAMMRGFAELEPENRLAALEGAFDVAVPPVRRMAMEILLATAVDMPAESMPLLVRGLTDESVSVAAAASKALPVAAREDPEAAMPHMELAMSRTPSVRRHVGKAVLLLADCQPDTCITWLDRLIEDDPIRVDSHGALMQLVAANPKRFNLDCAQLGMIDSPWRKLLEKHVAVSDYNVIDAAYELEGNAPSVGINLVLLAQQARENLPQKGRGKRASTLPPYSYVYSLLNYARQPEATSHKAVFDRVMASPDVAAYYDGDLKLLASDGYYHATYEWKHAKANIPAIKSAIDALFPGRSYRVDDTSPEYRASREVDVDQGSVRPLIFGADVVHVPGRTPVVRKNSAAFNSMYNKIFDIDLGKIVSGIPDSVQGKAAYLEGLHRSQGGHEQHQDRFRSFLAAHVDEMMQRYDEVMDLLPSWRGQVLDGLPAVVDREFAERRLDDTKFVLYDRLHRIMNKYYGYDAVGSFYENKSSAEVDLTRPLYKIKATYVHEALHAMSGRAIVVRPRSMQGPQKVVNQRIGLLFYGRQNHFQWLNEAVTEFWTQQIVGDGERNIYYNERSLWHTILTCGNGKLSTELFTNAYFENFNPNAPDKVPHWHTLQAALHQAYGRPILLELDKVVATKGVNAGIDYLHSDSQRRLEEELRHGREKHEAEMAAIMKRAEAGLARVELIKARQRKR